jgi:MoaA/NifB/PqqE/SkfB family radical SAM enzyme
MPSNCIRGVARSQHPFAFCYIQARKRETRKWALLQIKPILQTWGRVLSGRVPTLSIEITRECPLRCPGCYAYEDAHLGTTNLRSLADFRGEELIRRVLALVDEHQPLHLSIVGGDPLVRYRELEVLLPQLSQRGIHVQVVTSAFRPISPAWASIPNLRVTVSVDGLQPDHDVRRKPATYDKILRNIQGQHVAIHCTITSAVTRRPGYLREFLTFWSDNVAVEKVWMSIFTPQRGANPVECLSVEERQRVITELIELRKVFPKLDMPEAVLREYLAPPKSPAHCIFARTTLTLSADLKTNVEPCQFGGDPDCSRCGCIASMGLASIGNHKVIGPLTAGHLFWASASVGDAWQRARGLMGRGPGAVEEPPPSEEEQPEELVKIAS